MLNKYELDGMRFQRNAWVVFATLSMIINLVVVFGMEWTIKC